LIALEATDVTNGPLIYYPGSHKLPYLKNADLGLKENRLLLDENPNAKYEQKIQEVLDKNKLHSLEFHANSGDVLIWHGNLVHGGKKMLDNNRTRKSMVIHYLREESLCWHELSQRPALVEKIK
jgi:ectoine hydroxylase